MKNDSYYYGDNLHSHATLGWHLPEIEATLTEIIDKTKMPKVIEIGSGNGALIHTLKKKINIIGIEPSDDRVRIANLGLSQPCVYKRSVSDDLSQFGKFDVVISIDVVEHVLHPDEWAEKCYDLLEKNGVGIFTTTYHSYIKNLFLALTGKMSAHLDPLWRLGRIKFFTIATFDSLLTEAGFKIVKIKRTGRVPILAKSIYVVCIKE